MKKKNNPLYIQLPFWYCILSICAILLAISILILPDSFAYNKFFFSDSLDTGMDFFHSIEYTRGRTPYIKFNTLYPPLANLLFLAIYMFIPKWQVNQWADTFESSIAARGTYIDLRIWQPTLILFILFVICSVICIIYIGVKYLELNNTGYLIILCTFFSHSMLWAYERGNIIILSYICTMFFAFFYDSSSKVCRELSMIFLAIAAGIKIYPAIFGILLLYNRDYKRAFRLIVYGIIFFVFPCFAFKEGLSCIPHFIKILISYSSDVENYIDGFSADKLLNSILLVITRNNTLIENQILFNSTLVNLFSSVMVLTLGFFKAKKWEKVLGCCLALVLIQSQPIYVLLFMLIPLLIIIKEEKTISKHNIIYFVLLVLVNLFLPAFNDTKYISGTYIRFQVCIGGLMVCYILSFYFNIFHMKQKEKTGNKI